MIQVQVDTQEGDPPPLPHQAVVTLVTGIFTGNGAGEARVQIVFSTDEHLRQLKRQFFGEDVYTDVIAFNLNEEHECLEGEIYISTERALDNSRRYHVSHTRELYRLVTHGCLHLLGYDDGTTDEQIRMRRLEDCYLATLAEGRA